MNAIEIIQHNAEVDSSRDFIASTGIYGHELSDGYSPNKLSQYGRINIGLGLFAAGLNHAYVGMFESEQEAAKTPLTDFYSGESTDVVINPTQYNLSVGGEVLARGMIVASVLMVAVGAIQLAQSRKVKKESIQSVAAVDSSNILSRKLNVGFSLEDLERAREEIRIARLADEMAAEQARKQAQ